MTPNELLALTPIKYVKSDGLNNEEVFSYLKNSQFDHLPEVCPSDFGEDFVWYESMAGLNNRLSVKIYKEEHIDHSRMDVVGVLFYAAIPVMVFAHKGRSGGDTVDRWVFNDVQFKNMITYLNELLVQLTDEDLVEVFSVEDDIPELVL